MVNHNKHHLRATPNIVNCQCEKFELTKYSLLPYTSTKPLYYYLENRPTTKTDLTLKLVTEKRRHNYLLTRYKSNYLVSMSKLFINGRSIDQFG